MLKSKALCALVVLLPLFIFIYACSEKKQPRTISNRSDTEKASPNTLEVTPDGKAEDSLKNLTVDDIGEVMGRDGTAIFFYTKFNDKAHLEVVTEHFKKQAIQNKQKNVYVNFFDARPSSVRWSYPMSNELMECWLAEYVYSTKTYRDELRFIKR